MLPAGEAGAQPQRIPRRRQSRADRSRQTLCARRVSGCVRDPRARVSRSVLGATVVLGREPVCLDCPLSAAAPTPPRGPRAPCRSWVARCGATPRAAGSRARLRRSSTYRCRARRAVTRVLASDQVVPGYAIFVSSRRSCCGAPRPKRAFNAAIGSRASASSGASGASSRYHFHSLACMKKYRSRECLSPPRASLQHCRA